MKRAVFSTLVLAPSGIVLVKPPLLNLVGLGARPTSMPHPAIEYMFNPVSTSVGLGVLGFGS